jgi:hypothetical protein
LEETLITGHGAEDGRVLRDAKILSSLDLSRNSLWFEPARLVEEFTARRLEPYRYVRLQAAADAATHDC